MLSVRAQMKARPGPVLLITILGCLGALQLTCSIFLPNFTQESKDSFLGNGKHGERHLPEGTELSLQPGLGKVA